MEHIQIKESTNQDSNQLNNNKNQFVVVTEIYFNNEKIAESRVEKQELTRQERNTVIRQLFLNYNNSCNLKRTEIYIKLATLLKELYNIIFSDRSVMRVCTEVPSEIFQKQFTTNQQTN